MTARNIRTLILDLDGPLIDGRLRHYTCYADILLELGYRPIPLDWYWEMKRMGAAHVQVLSLSDAGRSSTEFIDAWHGRIEESKYLDLDVLHEGVVPTLLNWKCSGVTLVLATMRKDPEQVEWQLERLGIAMSFDCTVVIGHAGDFATKAAAVDVVLAKADRQQMYWVGDTELDIQAARALNIKICALSCGLRSAEFLATYTPDRLDANLAEFAGWLAGLE